VEVAMEELERCAGTQFDPQVVRMFVEEVRRDPGEGDGARIAAALDDPELALRRSGDEPLLGYGSLELTDSLTLLYSHRYFHERVAAEAERAAVQEQGFALLMIQLSEIAETNRLNGYAAGDAEIQVVARALQRIAVRCGGTAARYTGRRFALLVPGEDAGAAELLAEQLSGELDDDGPAVKVSVAAWQPGDAGDDVIARARGALVAV
jgi:diguanylate cyclase (GGDEF)-like protein